MKLFYNGTIHTIDPAYPSPEAVLISDNGRIQAVGAFGALEKPGVTRIEMYGD